jgi:hypothetical protein
VGLLLVSRACIEVLGRECGDVHLCESAQATRQGEGGPRAEPVAHIVVARVATALAVAQ